MFSTNPKNEDAVHPTRTENLTLINAGDNNLVLFHRPSLGYVTNMFEI